MDGGDSNAEGVNCQDADRPLVSSESVAKSLMNGGFSPVGIPFLRRLGWRGDLRDNAGLVIVLCSVGISL